ncbi:hypothetical protein HDU76_011071 [Blyttiomyces sp. JEL0837]|nr:hypothetical protein HDU76_011071 [Blyttiomyces sp. JEL0837]
MSFHVDDRDRELEQIFAELKGLGMDALDASKNELAKAHARYLVGGRKDVSLPILCRRGLTFTTICQYKVKFERLFRFSFPERPNALGHFLGSLRSPTHDWNVSLFHYR